jgi:beta-xylosidase
MVKLFQFKKTIFVLLLGAYNFISASNPIIPYVGMADPHIFIFNNKAYLFTTRDKDSAAHKFVMPEWNIWSSTNLVDWKHERTINPTETYMGKSDNCWATDHAFRNGKYYFYFSNGNVDTGVMIADKPEGPYKDALGKPLLDVSLSSGKEYDPTVFVDDNKKGYLIYGHFRENDPKLSYFLVELNDDMISFEKKPERIQIEGDINVLRANDKPNLHKRNGTYYLSAGSHYATSKSIYGPYTRAGSTGSGKYGLDSRAHGNFFEWNNQWFHTWCHFHLTKEVAHYRESYISYLHYKNNGEMVTDTTFLAKHFATGVGQYNANWEKIEAEWYMEAENAEKRESTNGGFELQKISNKTHVYFPNIKNVDKATEISFSVLPLSSGKIKVYADKNCKQLLASVAIAKSENHNTYQVIKSSLKNKTNATGVYLTFQGKGKDILHLDWIKFN